MPEESLGRIDSVDAPLAAVDSRVDPVIQRIGVMHEDLIRRIAGISERDAVSRKEHREAIAELVEKFGRRLDPLEATVRSHSADLADLKRKR